MWCEHWKDLDDPIVAFNFRYRLHPCNTVVAYWCVRCRSYYSKSTTKWLQISGLSFNSDTAALFVILRFLVLVRFIRRHIYVRNGGKWTGASWSMRNWQIRDQLTVLVHSRKMGDLRDPAVFVGLVVTCSRKLLHFHHIDKVQQNEPG